MKSKKFKLSAIVFCIVIVASGLVLPNMAFAQQSGDFTYEVSGGTVTITQYTGTGGPAVIPAAIDGMPVVGIGDLAFAQCTSLTSVTIPDSVTSIGVRVFLNCGGLTSVTIGNSVTSIGDGAFEGCSGLTSVTIPDSVTSIGAGAFLNCGGLTSVTIPDSVMSIRSAAFAGCSGLASIVVDASNTVYSSQDGVLYNKAKTALIQYPGGKSGGFTIPNSVMIIWLQAFRDCKGLTSVAIGNSVTSIGGGAFYECTSLTSVTIPESVTSIEDYVFYGCTSLTSVTIGNSVTSIGDSAFDGCSALTSVTIPGSVTSIGDNAFAYCTGLTSIVVVASNTVYSSQDGVLYNKAMTVLILCPKGKSGGLTIPDSVTSIGNWAFSGCTSLTSVTIGNSVTIIGVWAFSHCTGLTTVTIGNSVTSIGFAAFSDCTGLTSVTIPDSVTIIAENTFSYCTGLTSVTIGNSVTSIGYQAFAYCTGLANAYFSGNAPSMGPGVFLGCSSDFTVCYTAGGTGFTTPTWCPTDDQCYPAAVCSPKPSLCAAEAIYGENSEQTQLLRAYRDNVLSKTPEGQEIIESYYKYSPAATKLLENMPLLKIRAKAFIDSMLPGIRKKIEESDKEL